MLINRYGALQEENFTHAHEFKPERWLESNPTACAHNRNASIPFGAGPRFCPGRNLALLEIKMAMAFYARIFRLPVLKQSSPFKRFFYLL
jgi:cytochrome P450